MSLVKAVGTQAMNKTGLRVLLVVFSIAGVLSVSALTGNPIDFDSVSSLFKLLLDTAMVAFGAHFSYKAIKYA